jgi:hypothetical protein
LTGLLSAAASRAARSGGIAPCAAQLSTSSAFASSSTIGRTITSPPTDSARKRGNRFRRRMNAAE